MASNQKCKYQLLPVMLRRPATTIKLTPEDILEYDDSVLLQQSASISLVDHNQEQDKSLTGIIFKEPLQNKNERIGVTRNERSQ